MSLSELVRRGSVMILSGAGLSTESGIPDYRGPTGAARRASPMTYQVFTGDAAARQRYWARSHVGWRLMAGAVPNDGHRAVTALQQAGLLSGVVTQNVDGLHDAAGTSGVVELHGALRGVVCLRCGDASGRPSLDARLTAANPGWSAQVSQVNPDGDVELDDTGFVVVDCDRCGGLLKPDVVFFGETVPANRVSVSFALLARSQLLLVLGSSLKVMSGHRFVLRATKTGVPVAIVNQGVTRGDPFATVKVDGALGEVLPELVSAAAREQVAP